MRVGKNIFKLFLRDVGKLWFGGKVRCIGGYMQRYSLYSQIANYKIFFLKNTFLSSQREVPHHHTPPMTLGQKRVPLKGVYLQYWRIS